MFKKKGTRYIVELNPSEVRLMITSWMNISTE